MAKRPTKTSRPRSEAARAREERWRVILSEQKTSGLGHTAFCREKKISAHAYFWWKREIRVRDGGRRRPRRKKPGKKPHLVPVLISDSGFVEGGGRENFEVVLSGQRVVRVPAGFDALLCVTTSCTFVHGTPPSYARGWSMSGVSYLGSVRISPSMWRRRID